MSSVLTPQMAEMSGDMIFSADDNGTCVDLGKLAMFTEERMPVDAEDKLSYIGINSPVQSSM